MVEFAQVLCVGVTLAAIFWMSSASECQVTPWGQWGECLGSCVFAMRVRNRDVGKPPFPELASANGALLMEPCPPLYQVQQCSPKQCLPEINSTRAINRTSAGTFEKDQEQRGRPVNGKSPDPEVREILRLAEAQQQQQGQTPNSRNAESVTARSALRALNVPREEGHRWISTLWAASVSTPGAASSTAGPSTSTSGATSSTSGVTSSTSGPSTSTSGPSSTASGSSTRSPTTSTAGPSAAWTTATTTSVQNATAEDLDPSVEQPERIVPSNTEGLIIPEPSNFEDGKIQGDLEQQEDIELPTPAPANGVLGKQRSHLESFLTPTDFPRPDAFTRRSTTTGSPQSLQAVGEFRAVQSAVLDHLQLGDQLDQSNETGSNSGIGGGRNASSNSLFLTLGASVKPPVETAVTSLHVLANRPPINISETEELVYEYVYEDYDKPPENGQQLPEDVVLPQPPNATNVLQRWAKVGVEQSNNLTAIRGRFDPINGTVETSTNDPTGSPLIPGWNYTDVEEGGSNKTVVIYAPGSKPIWTTTTPTVTTTSTTPTVTTTTTSTTIASLSTSQPETDSSQSSTTTASPSESTTTISTVGSEVDEFVVEPQLNPSNNSDPSDDASIDETLAVMIPPWLEGGSSTTTTKGEPEPAVLEGGQSEAPLDSNQVLPVIKPFQGSAEPKGVTIRLENTTRTTTSGHSTTNATTLKTTGRSTAGQTITTSHSIKGKTTISTGNVAPTLAAGAFPSAPPFDIADGENAAFAQSQLVSRNKVPNLGAPRIASEKPNGSRTESSTSSTSSASSATSSAAHSSSTSKASSTVTVTTSGVVKTTSGNHTTTGTHSSSTVSSTTGSTSESRRTTDTVPSTSTISISFNTTFPFVAESVTGTNGPVQPIRVVSGSTEAGSPRLINSQIQTSDRSNSTDQTSTTITNHSGSPTTTTQEPSPVTFEISNLPSFGTGQLIASQSSTSQLINTAVQSTLTFLRTLSSEHTVTEPATTTTSTISTPLSSESRASSSPSSSTVTSASSSSGSQSTSGSSSSSSSSTSGSSSSTSGSSSTSQSSSTSSSLATSSSSSTSTTGSSSRSTSTSTTSGAASSTARPAATGLPASVTNFTSDDLHRPCGDTFGNRRCCKIGPRARCPSGRLAQQVVRWYRSAGINKCVSYSYGYCGMDTENLEQPLKFQEDCYEACFTDEEKKTLPIFGQLDLRKSVLLPISN